MRFQIATALLGVVSLVGTSASALPHLHRHHHHRTYVIQTQPTYVQPAQPAPQVNVQVSPNGYDYGPRGGGPGIDEHQWQEQQDLRQHQLQEQQELREHQMREAYPQY